MSRPRRTALLVVALAVTACGGGDDVADTAVTTADATSTTAADGSVIVETESLDATSGPESSGPVVDDPAGSGPATTGEGAPATTAAPDVTAPLDTAPSTTEAGGQAGGDDEPRIPGIDAAALLGEAEIEALGIGEGWISDVEPDTIEPGEAPCGLDALSGVEHWYGDAADDLGNEFEQALFPSLGPVGVDRIRGLPACTEFADEFGADIAPLALGDIPGATDAVMIGADDDGFVLRWLAADVDGKLVLVFYGGDGDVTDRLVDGFRTIVARV